MSALSGWSTTGADRERDGPVTDIAALSRFGPAAPDPQRPGPSEKVRRNVVRTTGRSR